MSTSSNQSSPAEGASPSTVGGMYKTVGTALTIVVAGGLAWGLALTVVKAIAIFTA